MQTYNFAMNRSQAVRQTERQPEQITIPERVSQFVGLHPYLTKISSILLAAGIFAQCAPLFTSRFVVSEADIRKACGLITDLDRSHQRQGVLHVQTGSAKHREAVDNDDYKPGLLYNDDLEVFRLDTRQLDVLTDTPDINETDAGVFNGRIIFVRNGQAVLDEKQEGLMQRYHREYNPANGVYSMDIDGQNERKIAETPDDGSSDNYPVLSEDGNFAAWRRTSKVRDEVYADNIVVADLKKGSLNQITSYYGDEREFISRMALSPDSSQIAFIGSKGVEVMPVGGGKSRKITPSGDMDGPEGSDQELVWVDDDQIAVLNHRRMNRGMMSEEFPHNKIFRRRHGLAFVSSGGYRNITGECYAMTQE